MKICSAYLVHIHRYGFRAGTPGEIVGVKIVSPDVCNRNPHPAYVVRFPDGIEDFVAVEDSENFRIISGEDVVAGRIPEVTR